MQLLYLKGYEAIRWHKPHRCLLCFYEIKLCLFLSPVVNGRAQKKNKGNSCESFVYYGLHGTLRARVRKSVRFCLRLHY